MRLESQSYIYLHKSLVKTMENSPHNNFNLVDLGTRLMDWAEENPCSKVSISSEGWPDDPRSVSPAMAVAATTLLQTTLELVETNPGCQAWNKDGTSNPTAGAALAKLFKECELPIWVCMFNAEQRRGQREWYIIKYMKSIKGAPGAVPYDRVHWGHHSPNPDVQVDILLVK